MRSKIRPLFAVLLLAGLTLPMAANVAAAQQRDEAGEAAMFERINAVRAEQGLSPLSRDARLDAAARTQSVDMAWHQSLEHVSPRTGSPADRVTAAGLSPQALAENIAFNGDAAEAQAGLEASAAHMQNILGRASTHVGLCVVYADGGVYVTQVFAAIAAAPEATPEPAPAPPPPAVAPAPPPPAPTPAAPAVAQPALAPAAPAAPAVAAGTRRIAGYWVQHAGRWYYYPMPPNAQPGQRLQPDLSVTGPPPAHLLRQQATR